MKVQRARSVTQCFVACLLLTPITHAIDVDVVAITSGSAREDGALLEYFLSFTVEGTDIASGRVLKPGSPPTEICALVNEADNDWNCDLLGFTSLDDICQTIGFGDFLFELTAAVGSDDTLTLFFDPGCADPISGYPVITAPMSGGMVSPVPGPEDFCWDCSAPGACGPGDTTVSLFDMGDMDLAVDVLRDVSVPACWDPGICIPTGPDDEFEVSALLIFADFETRLTDLGDELIYLSAFQNLNYTLYNVTDPVPTTPPAVPDGSGASSAMQAAKLDPAGLSIEVNWDGESCCGVADHHLVYGTSADLPAVLGGIYALDGSACTLGAASPFTWTSVPDPGVGDFLWWLVLANDTAVTEGSWGIDSSAQERMGSGAGGVSAQCGMTVKDLANSCGR